jgi:site-specific DNA-methyltransferase (adenine-specific)
MFGIGNHPGNGVRIGDSGSAARFFYCAKSSRNERTCGGAIVNGHPTIKPLALMRYLCRLVTPPNGLILDPFMGSGTTGMAAKLEGFRFTGIEKEKEYCEIAERRISNTP